MNYFERKANYHETDQMGVIHHSNYVKWMEEARVAFLDSLGLSYKNMETLGIYSPVNSISLDYKNPVLFDQIVHIYIKIKEYTGVKIVLEYEIIEKESNKVCVIASSKHCFIKDGRIVSLKKAYPEFHKLFEDYCASV